jgi:hypothetical protein
MAKQGDKAYALAAIDFMMIEKRHYSGTQEDLDDEKFEYLFWVESLLGKDTKNEVAEMMSRLVEKGLEEVKIMAQK